MTAEACTKNERHIPESANLDPTTGQVVDIEKVEARRRSRRNQQQMRNRLLDFINELRRRKVCRAITTYSVTLWLICQIIEIVAPHLGLPPWTLKLVLVLGLVGLPIALILAWLFDLTPDGVVSDSADRDHAQMMQAARGTFDKAIDCCLVVVALVIGIQLATGILSTESVAQTNERQKVAIEQFRIGAGASSAALSEGIFSELQLELVRNSNFVVVVPQKNVPMDNSISLTGAVAANESDIRVTVALIDNSTGEVTWSRVFKQPNADPLIAPSLIAKDIAASLPQSVHLTVSEESNNASQTL